MIPRHRKCRSVPDRRRGLARQRSGDTDATPFSWRRILVPMKFSPELTILFDYAHKLAVRDAADVVLLHVVEPFSDLRDFGYGPVVWRRPNTFAMARAKSKLRGLARRRLGTSHDWSVLIRSGAICDEIVKASKEMNVGLIIMATDGLLPSEPMKLAGMAARVNSRAPCPVLVLKNPGSKRSANYDQ